MTSATPLNVSASTTFPFVLPSRTLQEKYEKNCFKKGKKIYNQMRKKIEQHIQMWP